MRPFFPLLCTMLSASTALATNDCTADAMLVFDGSGSMAEMGFNDINEPRIFEARRAMAETIPQIARDRRLGLVIYGPNGVDACSGVDVRFAPMSKASIPILNAVENLEPEGSTALTQAVRLAAQTLEYETRPATILLVTDGKETCGGMPCALASELANRGQDTTVHVIGFKVRGAFFSWDRQNENDKPAIESAARCLADQTGGTYASAETLDQLIAAMRVTLGCNVLF
ncbi:MAG: VWA domain-containing protein [Sulfitobacter sp.]